MKWSFDCAYKEEISRKEIFNQMITSVQNAYKRRVNVYVLSGVFYENDEDESEIPN